MANSTDPGASKGHVVAHTQTEPGDPMAFMRSPSPDQVATPSSSVISTMSRLLKGKQREIRGPAGPLRLLDLPIDILRLIVKEPFFNFQIKQTNDLTTLALTCSTLYQLAVPQIYARFDIVWPDSASLPSTSKSVDALTYGLSTLCLGSKFGQRTRWLRGGAVGGHGGSGRLNDNQYAKYTRKFGLGNGPPMWVSEYNITKESGKMLGTLVSLAVAKMVNLETFVWDMPTGVLSDVFMALASLPDHSPDGRSKLEKVHIRWHENWQGPAGTASSTSSPVMAPAHSVSAPHVFPVQPVSPALQTLAMLSPPKYSESQVEYPTFSILPPVKSLTVLDIDELAYLDEISVLVERSQDSLQELRLGIHHKALSQDFANTWEGDNLRQVDFEARWPGESTIGDRRLGGVLGVVVGRVFELRRKGSSKSKQQNSGSLTPNTDDGSTNGWVQSPPGVWVNGLAADGVNVDSNVEAGDLPPPREQKRPTDTSNSEVPPIHSKGKRPRKSGHLRKKRLDGKLRLQTLELERVTLSINVCCKAFDWSRLTNLTILNCNHSDALWRALRKRFQPTPPSHGSPVGTPTQYHLVLKKLHCDATTHALLSFIKETLEPNTLEVLFLQDRRRTTPPTVTIEMVFRIAVKRHHSSLKKLLLDSNEKLGREPYSPGSRWRNWVLMSEMVSYITSGRMSQLRELAVALHYRDWHLFLQRLPNIPQLRSLYVLQIQDHLNGSFEPKDLALQLVDIITLRPEVQLCYVGIRNKCFEVLECSPTYGVTDHFGSNGSAPHQAGGAISVIDLDEEDNEDGSNNNSEADETEDEDDDAGTHASSQTDHENDDDFTEVSDIESDADDFEEPEHSQSTPRLRLREILFYDDKVAVFKARHGRL
ncbi:hypothetical protein SUNI508_06163 [Seiridium unicorne]|uniref:F-box domain-containing protein n=1 Tax=Seiridium unicorne TaxID=138068 RepID=A0ABR2V2Z5_9PEZI